MKKVIWLSLIVALFAACSPQGPPDAPERPGSPATLEILEPEAGATVGPDLTVRLRLEGARIIEEVKTDLRPDEGHIHLSLNGETITLLGSLEEVITGLEPGAYLLEAEFVAADHGPWNPRIISTVTFTVE